MTAIPLIDQVSAANLLYFRITIVYMSSVNKQLFYEKQDTALTQQCILEKYRAGTIAETLSSGGRGCGAEKCRHGMTEDGAWAGTGDLMAIASSAVGSYRNADLDLGKTSFTGNEEIVSKIHNIHKFGCNLDLQTHEERQRCKIILTST